MISEEEKRMYINNKYGGRNNLGPGEELITKCH